MHLDNLKRMESDKEQKNKRLPILTTIEHNIDFTKYKKIYVGFSGGADSTALLFIMKLLSKKYVFPLSAIHFEHGLRGQASLNDATWCAKLCCKLKINFQCLSLNVKNNIDIGESIETGARRLRLLQWGKICKNGEAVALGHNLDDKIENLFLRMFRGSNSSGLTSLRPIYQVDNITFLRPLLSLSRQTIENFLISEGFHNWRLDKTNQENEYKRNLLRNQILPKIYQNFIGAKDGIVHAFETIKSDAEYLEQTALQEYEKYKKQNHLPIKQLINMHDAIKIRLLRYWLSDLLGTDFIPNRELMSRLNSELQSHNKRRKLIPLQGIAFLKIENQNLTLHYENTKPIAFSLDWEWRKKTVIKIANYTQNDWIVEKYCYSLDSKLIYDNPKNGYCCVYQIQAEILNCKPEKLKVNNNISFFDLDQIPNILKVRSWNDGDRVNVFGLDDKSVKVKKIFINDKVSIEKRKTIPLLCLQNGIIIWIPGVKRSNFAPVTNSTSKVVVFKLF